MQSATHESFTSNQRHKGSSDRSFGVVFAIFFALVTFWPLLHGRHIRSWAAGVSVAFLLVAFTIPAILHPLNVIWTRLGLLISKITNPIVTGLMFFVIFTPAALLMKAFGKDLLNLKYDNTSKSYWILRDPPGPLPESMRNQF